MSEQSHKIKVTVGGYNGVTYEMVCSDPDNCQAVFQEKSWNHDNACRCTDGECACREGDHSACSEFGRYIQGLGPECRQVPVEGCGLIVWLNELGEEALDVWEDVTIEVPVIARWETEDGPVFRVEKASA